MIVVTTPTGQIGNQVLENVLRGGEPVRVIVRNPDGLSSETVARVEVVAGSHGDPEVVGDAFEGADSVFWLCPPDPRAPSAEAAYVDFTPPAAAGRSVSRGGQVRAVVGYTEADIPARRRLLGG